MRKVIYEGKKINENSIVSKILFALIGGKIKKITASNEVNKEGINKIKKIGQATDDFVNFLDKNPEARSQWEKAFEKIK